jgi:molybdenum cofactor cytidylyltransferase
MTSTMKLYQAFDLRRGEVVALIGAGGKTSALLAIGYELAEAGWRVLATTTTRISTEQLEMMPRALGIGVGAEAISEALTQQRFVFIYDEIRGVKVYGPPLTQISWLLDSVDADLLLIEADGARRLPFKAPHDHEPVIPSETTLAIPIVSLSVLGQPLDDEHVYNAQAMIDRFGFYPGSPVKSPWVAQVLRDETMGLRGVPEHARVMAFLNGTPATGYLRGRARLIARLVLRSSRVQGVVLGSARAADPVVEVQRPVGAVVLAAGMSTRMGQAKVLLPWLNDKPILEHIIDQLHTARVDHIVVVTGHYADDVRRIADRLGVETVHNADYAQGEMLSSLQAGLRAMPENIGAAMTVLGDQPRIQSRIVAQVMMAYAEGKGEIIAPSYQMRRGHPILISRRFWPELLALGPGAAPRDVINAHADQTGYVEVNTDSVLRDVDTMQDYEQERKNAGLRP